MRERAGRLVLVLALVAGCSGESRPAATPAAAAPPVADRVDGPAVHGMVLAGQQAFQLSHLAMFHAPHDFQVLLTVRIPDTAAAELAAARRASPALLYTIAPAPFRLADVRPGFRFHADLVRGHFERGGETVVPDAELEVERVVHLRRLDPGAARPAVLGYILFGRPGEAFLAHRITAPPDFNQLLAVEAPPGLSAEALARGVEVTFPGQPSGEPLRAASRYPAVVGGAPGDLAVGAELYLERGELAE